ncbi:MYPU_1760 family metalloprotease [Mycoplasma sp. 1458C]|uniref:MYPU_1760 family metalloprotease n=1 Tax=Mycoplasma sp. 1458C TaxID=3401661 RepID=UPI003AAB4EEA
MGKKRKIIGWSILSVGILMGLGAIATSAYFAASYLLQKDDDIPKETINIKPHYETPAWQAEPKLLKIGPNEVEIFDNLTSKEKTEALALVNSVGDINWEAKTNDEGTYVEYVDPYTKVKFRDFAYKVDKENPANNRYLLGPGGLAYLANEFKRKVTFGPEIYDLEAININDFAIIPATANGLYIPSTKNIYINGAFMCETNATLYDRVATIMQTLFHEYMHHWANNYAEIALPNLDNVIPTGLATGPVANIQDKEMVTVKYYEPSQNKKDSLLDKIFSSANEQYWNGYFADNFRYLLNYDVAAKSYIKPEILALLRDRWFGQPGAEDVSDALYTNFSPKDLWDVSNGIYNSQGSPKDPLILQKRLESKPWFWYSPDEKFALNNGDLRYYYSLTELVPREYLKFAFESYYNINEPNPAIIAEKNRQEFSSGYFGNMKFNYNAKASSYEIRPSSIAEDYGKVFMNNFDTLTRQGWYIDDSWGNIDPDNPITFYDLHKGEWVTKIVQGSSSIMIPASPFALDSYNTFDRISKSQEAKIKTNKAHDFYKMFLYTMGYGSEIAQIYYDNSGWKWVGKNFAQVQKNENNITKIKFSGYLKDKTHTGIAVVDDKGQVVAHSDIIYLDTFNFFGHQTFDKGAKIENAIQANGELRQAQLANRLYPTGYISYITKDYIVPGEKGSLYFWDDLNKNGIVENNELVKDHQIKLPTNRWVTTRRADNPNYYYVVENKNNQTTIKWETPR